MTQPEEIPAAPADDEEPKPDMIVKPDVPATSRTLRNMQRKNRKIT